MKPYTDFSQYYDIIYKQKEYEKEAQFVHSLIQQYDPGSKSILEIACGTGTHAIHLDKMGYNVIATDISENMVNMAFQKAKEVRSAVKFRVQDMSCLEIPEAPFDAVICLFDAIGYVVTNNMLKKTLNGIHDHLRSGGTFIFEFWHNAALLKSYSPIRSRRWPLEDGELIRISETSLQPAAQTAVVEYSFYHLRKDGTYHAFRESHVNRYFSVPEMDYWLQSSGFTPVNWFCGFSPNEKITDATWHILAVARKNSSKPEMI